MTGVPRGHSAKDGRVVSHTRHGYYKRNWPLYILIFPGVLLTFIFCYMPMYGIIMSIQNFKPALGFFHSPLANPWYRNFVKLFTDPYFPRILGNSLKLGVFSLLWTFPAPIILALLFNELRAGLFKRVTQTISYMPHFLSTVIVIGMLKLFLASDGPITHVLARYGIKMVNPLMLPSAFRSLYIISSVWMDVGFNTIIYLAAITGINPELYEAAMIDGASRLQRTAYVTLPGIVPTITYLLIFSISGIITSDWQKILLLYNEATYSTADTIGTYVYRVGLNGNATAYATAVSLFNNVVSVLLLTTANTVAKRIGENSLW